MEFTDFAGGGRVRSGLQRGEASDAGVDVGDPLDDGDGHESGTDSPDVLGGLHGKRSARRTARQHDGGRCFVRCDRGQRVGHGGEIVGGGTGGNQHEIGLAGSLAGSVAFAGSGVQRGPAWHLRNGRPGEHGRASGGGRWRRAGICDGAVPTRCGRCLADRGRPRRQRRPLARGRPRGQQPAWFCHCRPSARSRPPSSSWECKV